jgi:hypothetical protein
MLRSKFSPTVLSHTAIVSFCRIRSCFICSNTSIGSRMEFDGRAFSKKVVQISVSFQVIDNVKSEFCFML